MRRAGPALEKILSDGLINILFVGRIVPTSGSRITSGWPRSTSGTWTATTGSSSSGRTDGMPRYYAQIRALINEFQMLPDRFWFTGPVPDEDLAAFYRWADVYVSLSEHEGFCVPLVEAMAADVPVLAYAAGAVPETLGGAGVLFAPKDLEFAAEMMGTLVYDRSVREGVLEGQRRRLADFAPAQIRATADGQFDEGHALKIAFIVQRYGTEILGGSEYHCRLIAERLAPKHQVEVLTTCAQDYITWDNEYAEGTDRVRGVTVRRFANARSRDIQAFNRYSEWIFNHEHTPADEMEWLKEQGPWCPALLEYLERNQQQYDVLIFFTYLYAPTVLGMRIAPHKSILVPTAHDEPAIHLGIYRELFSLPAAVAYNTEVERKFLTGHFSIRAIEEETVGCGVDLPQAQAYPREHMSEGDLPREEEPEDPSPSFRPHLAHRGSVFRRRHRLHGPIALYGGRIDPGKGCEELIEYLQQLRPGRGRRLAGAHGREAHAAPRGAVHPFRRPAVRPGTPPGARSRHRRRRAVTVREPLAPGPRIVRRRHARALQRAQ